MVSSRDANSTRGGCVLSTYSLLVLSTIGILPERIHPSSNGCLPRCRRWLWSTILSSVRKRIILSTHVFSQRYISRIRGFSWNFVFRSWHSVFIILDTFPGSLSTANIGLLSSKFCPDNLGPKLGASVAIQLKSDLDPTWDVIIVEARPFRSETTAALSSQASLCLRAGHWTDVDNTVEWTFPSLSLPLLRIGSQIVVWMAGTVDESRDLAMLGFRYLLVWFHLDVGVFFHIYCRLSCFG